MGATSLADERSADERSSESADKSFEASNVPAATAHEPKKLRRVKSFFIGIARLVFVRRAPFRLSQPFTHAVPNPARIRAPTSSSLPDRSGCARLSCPNATLD